MKLNMDLSDRRKADASRNLVGLRGTFIMCVLLLGAYALEIVKGERTILSYTIMCSLLLVPSFIGLYIYIKKNKESISIRYLCGIGFMAMYTYILLTTAKDLVFCYAIVIFVLQTVYVDLRYSLSLGIYAIVINLVDIVISTLQDGMTPQELTNAEIKMACLILTCYFMMIVLRKIIEINEVNMEKVRIEKEQSQQLLEMVLDVANSITENIIVATEQTEQLNQEIDATQISMKELTEGTLGAQEAIKEQQRKTSEIDRYVDEVNETTDNIVDEIINAEHNFNYGEKVINQLTEQVKVSEKSGEHVAREMEGLKDSAKKMQSIVEIISDVANQTVLLALNANIEAARSGEAGKGFAVVASEISSLANQTDEATNDINKIFENVAKSIVEVVKSIDEMFECNKYQNEYIEKTTANFKEIHNNTKQISSQVENLKKTVKLVLEANKLVVGNIEDVSNVTSGVTRSASETLDSCNMNLDSIAKVKEIMLRLEKEAKQLQERT